MLFELLIVHPLKCVCKFSVTASLLLCVTSVTKFANLINGHTAVRCSVNKGILGKYAESGTNKGDGRRTVVGLDELD